MEKKIYPKSDFEYSFEKWLNGEPEPDHPLWRYDLKEGKQNPEYLKISKAKKDTFDWALKGVFALGKLDFLKKVEGLNQRRKDKLIKKLILDSNKKFEGFEIDDLISQKHPKKFDGIDGKKYLLVKNAFLDFQEGTNIGFSFFRNDFLSAVLSFELDEFYQEYVDNNFKEPESTNAEKPEKGEGCAVKYKLLNHFFNESKEYNSLRVKDQERLLGFILGCRNDTAKHIKNNANKKNPDGKYITFESEGRVHELIEKLKKGDIL